MISVNIQGGLGNQLFEYAFVYAAAKNLRTNFVLDNSESFIVPEFFTTSKIDVLVNRIPYVRRIYREQVRKLRNNNYIDCSDCWKKRETYAQNHAYYDGFFQSINYFIDYEKQIRRLFTIKKKYRQSFEEMYGPLFRDHQTLVIHVRRTDYLRHGEDKDLGAADLSLPKEYYMKALTMLREHGYIQGTKIIVTGDDLAWEKEQFGDISDVIFASNSMIIDFQLLMNADIVIGSNSTFAWWASYLNAKESKRILMPKYFLGYHVKKEFPNGIYDNTFFEQIEV